MDDWHYLSCLACIKSSLGFVNLSSRMKGEMSKAVNVRSKIDNVQNKSEPFD